MNLRWFIAIVTICLLVVSSFIYSAFIFGPIVEEKLSKVIDLKIVDVTRDGREVRFWININKYKQCNAQSFRYYISKGSNAVRMLVVVVNEYDTLVGTAQRPLGEGLYGPYKFIVPTLGFNDDFVLELQGTWDCHAGWQTHQSFGPFTVPAGANG